MPAIAITDDLTFSEEILVTAYRYIGPFTGNILYTSTPPNPSGSATFRFPTTRFND